jgi:uncharacterized membrane protein (UPF0182 family)
MISRALIWGLIALFVVLVLLLGLGAGFYTDILWYDSLGYVDVLWTRVRAQALLFALGAVLAFASAAICLVAIARAAPVWPAPIRRAYGRRPPVPPPFLSLRAGDPWIELFDTTPAEIATLVRQGTWLLAIVFAVLMGLVAMGAWNTVLRYLARQPFNVRDPLFGRDVSWYVFEMPLHYAVLGWIVLAALILLAGSAALYLYQFGGRWMALAYSRAARIHLLALVALLFGAMTWYQHLQAYELVFSTRGAVFGAGYTDTHAQLFAIRVLEVLSVVGVLAALADMFRWRMLLLPVLVAVWVTAAVVLGVVVPGLQQRLVVEPSEFARERPYIERNIQMTRLAYGLDKVLEVPATIDEGLQREDLIEHADTLENIRLWDYRPLRDTLNQVQTFRPYYEFVDVDVDRYVLGGRLRQVMISARELNPQRLPAQARTWVNQRLQFTHGYGAAVASVNEATPEGLPRLLVQDIPPSGEIPIREPGIYFGERMDSYVVVNTTAQEFDYPQGDQNAFTTYRARSGVRLSSFLRQLAYAWVFGDGNLLLSAHITTDSQVLYRRNITRRARLLAPFLRLDRDPYLVIADGKLYWIQDAYTVTNRYPYSQPYGSFNYIRNSVKIITDAYDGSLTFYIADQEDPLIRTYAAIYPTLFKPLDQMPPSLRQHIRYPEDLYLVQAQLYRTYHMQDPQVFYNKEDLWDIAQELHGDQPQPIEPYYVLMRLPGERALEFVLILPFTPQGRQNMIAWMAGRSDGPNYGKLQVFKYPKDRQVFGPLQIEARINQDPVISAQLTLWDQRGSQVIRGNLIVLPLGDTTLYVKPLYLQAEQSRIPELRRVVVAAGGRLVMEERLADALARLAGTAVGTAPGTTPSPPSGTPPGTSPAPTAPLAVAELARSALANYQRAQEALRNGDWAGYGAALRAMEQDLQRLAELTR